jgi:hypothetical protein
MPRKRAEGLAGMTIAELSSKAQLMDRIAEMIQECGLYGRRRRSASAAAWDQRAAHWTRGTVKQEDPTPKPSASRKPRAPRKQPQAAPAAEASAKPRIDPELAESARAATVTSDQPRRAAPLHKAPANPRPPVQEPAGAEADSE